MRRREFLELLGVATGWHFAARDIAMSAGQGDKMSERDGLIYALGNRGLWSTPTGADPTGETDNTDLLQAWIDAGIANGNPMFLPYGMYKISNELLADLSSSRDNPFYLHGIPGQSWLMPTAHGFNGLRVRGRGGNVYPHGELAGISVWGPNTKVNFADGCAGIVLDNYPMFIQRDLTVAKKLIGFDYINNCYDNAAYNLTVPRASPCHLGINIRNGPQSGSDMTWYNTQIQGTGHAINIQGGGGGYSFFGGQIGTASYTRDDGMGVIQLGWDYMGEVAHGGLPGVSFYRMTMEGINNRWAIRSYGDVQAIFNQCSYYSSNYTPETTAIGLLKATNAGSSMFTFNQCAHAGHWACALESMVEISGSSTGNNLVENDWFFSWPGINTHDASNDTRAGTFGGNNYNPISWGFQAGLASRGGYQDKLILGGKLLRMNGATLEWSADNITWTSV
jgi:hypothetical protein